MTRVGFCGLGVMGYPMAGHLAAAGHHVSVYNRTASRALEWVATNGHQAFPTPAEVASESDVVFLCVGNDDDVRQVMLGENGILDGAHKGLIIVDHTTTSATLARDMYESCAAHEVVFLDAPVSGGQAGAQNKALTVMCGSVSVDEFNAVASIISAYSRSCVRLGGIGSGQLTKMVNQICIAGLVQALSEGLAFAEHAGLDTHAVIDVISQGAAQSWQMQNRGHTMVDGQFDFGFAVEWMVKDLKYVVDEARRNGSTFPVTQSVLGFYEELVQEGDARKDTSSLIRRLQKD
jgi:3-hydroxyisobutyrate dehydrogenase-like beta-hydroxyacid dehydrogenase